MSRIIVISALLLVAGVSLGAQTPEPPLGSKVRVRVGGEDGHRFEGTFLGSTGDSITIVNDARTLRIATGDVSTIERSLGRSRSAGAGRGALWGLGVMLPLAIAGYSSAQCPNNDPNGAWCGTDWGMGIGGTILVLGAGTGALIGTIIGVERWEAAGVPTRIAISPTRGGVRAGLRLEF